MCASLPPGEGIVKRFDRAVGKQFVVPMRELQIDCFSLLTWQNSLHSRGPDALHVRSPPSELQIKIPRAILALPRTLRLKFFGFLKGATIQRRRLGSGKVETKSTKSIFTISCYLFLYFIFFSKKNLNASIHREESRVWFTAFAWTD